MYWQQIGDAIFVLDSERRIVDLNPAAQRLTGRAASEAVGRPVAWLLPELAGCDSWLNAPEAPVEIAFGEGEARQYFDVQVSPLSIDSDPMGYLVVSHNVTQRKRAEEARRESEEKFRQLFEMVSDALFLIDNKTGRIFEANPAASDLYGYSHAELLEKRNFDLSAEPTQTQTATRTGATYIPVRFHKKKDGTVFPVEITARHFVWRSHGVHVAAIRDITARIRAEEERERLIEDLDAFAQTVAHDLKNPLSTMIGFISVLKDDHASLSEDEIAEVVENVGRGAMKMQAIIDELLLLASIRRMEAVPQERLDMAAIVAEVQKRLAYLIGEYQAEVAAPTAWPAALGYAPWVEEVWVNYVSNALKYGGQPPRVTLGATPQADGMMRYWVRDNGPGIVPEAQTRLFSPLTDLDLARAKGHGLGLSIVRRIVEKLGGEVSVETAPGGGSVFSFTLRAATE